MAVANDYKNISQQRNLITKYPKSHFPKLTQKDYVRGYFIRYFVKLKTNKDSSIIELNEDDYKKYSTKQIFNAVSYFSSISLRWKITGTRENVILGNTKTVESKELLMPNISLKLGNRLQFWKDEK